jgi:hypothetical protein
VFHLDVVKVDLDVAYVAMAVHIFQMYVPNVSTFLDICCKCIFQMFQLFQTYVANVLSRCCKSISECCICCNDYTNMFQAYTENVAMVGPMLQRR